MTDVIYYIHIETNYVVGKGSIDGRGRTTFYPEFWYNNGLNSPNIQLNYTLRPEFTRRIFSLNRDIYTFCVGSYPCKYTWTAESQRLYDAQVVIPMAELEARLKVERPLYDQWLADREQNLTKEQLQAKLNSLYSDLGQLQVDKALCETLGSTGMITECLTNNQTAIASIQQRINFLELRILNEFPPDTVPDPTPDPTQYPDPTNPPSQDSGGIGLGTLLGIGGILVGVLKMR